MDNPIVWAVVLLAIAAMLFLFELVMPTGGMIGVMAGVSLVGGIVTLFGVSTTAGLVGAGVTVVLGIPLALTLMVKVWPNTPMARMMTLKSTSQEPQEGGGESGDDSVGKSGGNSGSASGGDSRGNMPKVGQTGVATTDMRPIGGCVIGDKRVQCLAEAGLIHAGTKVRVVAVDGIQIKVRAEDA